MHAKNMKQIKENFITRKRKCSRGVDKVTTLWTEPSLTDAKLWKKAKWNHGNKSHPNFCLVLWSSRSLHKDEHQFPLGLQQYLFYNKTARNSQQLKTPKGPILKYSPNLRFVQIQIKLNMSQQKATIWVPLLVMLKFLVTVLVLFIYLLDQPVFAVTFTDLQCCGLWTFIRLT